MSDLQETTVGSYKVDSRGDKVSLECLDKSGEFIIGAYITPRDAREVAAALVSVADELDQWGAK